MISIRLSGNKSRSSMDKKAAMFLVFSVSLHARLFRTHYVRNIECKYRHMPLESRAVG